MRRTVPSASLVAQTLPAPNATPYVLNPISILFVTRFVRGSIRAITLSERSAAHTLPAPYASPNGREAKGMRFVIVFDAGSMRTTRPSARSVVHTDPAADRTIPDDAPTWTVATGDRPGAAAAHAASAPAAAAVQARTRRSGPRRASRFGESGGVS